MKINYIQMKCRKGKGVVGVGAAAVSTPAPVLIMFTFQVYKVCPTMLARPSVVICMS